MHTHIKKTGEKPYNEENAKQPVRNWKQKHRSRQQKPYSEKQTQRFSWYSQSCWFSFLPKKMSCPNAARQLCGEPLQTIILACWLYHRAHILSIKRCLSKQTSPSDLFYFLWDDSRQKTKGARHILPLLLSACICYFHQQIEIHKMPVIEIIAHAQVKTPIHREAIAQFVFFRLWYVIALCSSFTPNISTINWSNLIVFIQSTPLS